MNAPNKEHYKMQKQKGSAQLQNKTPFFPRVDSENSLESLPAIQFEGRLYFQSDFGGCAMICDEIIRRIENSNESLVPIGFDLEWPVIYSRRNNTSKITNKTALAQLCLSARTCHLFHIYNVDKLPLAFVLLLSHPKVKLVGVNVTQDIRKLGRDFPGFPSDEIVKNNCIECGKLANQLYNTKERWSLSNLTAYMLKRYLNKSDSVRKSKWHKLPLNRDQRIYAATDAYVSLLIYLNIRSKLAERDSPTSPSVLREDIRMNSQAQK